MSDDQIFYAFLRAVAIGLAVYLFFQVVDITPIWTLLIGHAQGFYVGWNVRRAYVDKTGAFARPDGGGDDRGHDI